VPGRALPPESAEELNALYAFRGGRDLSPDDMAGGRNADFAAAGATVGREGHTYAGAVAQMQGGAITLPPGAETTSIGALGTRSVEDAGLQDLRDFVAGFGKPKAQSLGHVVRILRGFFQWLFEDELIPRNPALKLKEPKASKANPKALNLEELESSELESQDVV